MRDCKMTLTGLTAVVQSEQNEQQPHVPADLGWEPLDLTSGQVDYTKLLQGCSGVDQSVPGVSHQRGGSLAAYRRWASWSPEGLNLYAGRSLFQAAKTMPDLS